MPLPPVSEEEIADFVESWRQGNQKEAHALATRRERAKITARQMAKVLGKADSGIRKIWGFGSVFEGWRSYRIDSDIDLAMEGGDWSRALSQLPKGEFEVSLVDLADQPEGFGEHVRRIGVLLFENG